MSVAVVYHSGYGHTDKQAHAVAEGANAVLVKIDENGELTEEQWKQLDEAGAIVFGSPTYMGMVSWQFKKFADASSKRWFNMDWKDKFAAGFTNSASMNGDKGMTISYLITLAMQHGMVWIGTGVLPANTKDAQRNDINYLGGFSGVLAQSPADASPDEAPCAGDLETAKQFGQRVASFVK
ncbi:flavodoxin family protein [Vibrio alfacsensis]|uniref:Flavodoxin family protein n=1 Tax=Vibrio alfacsensis TaxID=1074311 RepID=A0ABN5PI46_9VIBR|nr:flavodoxin family protein [Vibrio alfacsensis]AXY02832.1 flavodoxin family protein [Vibrio alfacsensis]BBM66494.1 FMN reductase [Vibrio alfacsensis]BCN25901.1 FMN reductase [Vibrio alfacsensis]